MSTNSSQSCKAHFWAETVDKKRLALQMKSPVNPMCYTFCAFMAQTTCPKKSWHWGWTEHILRNQDFMVHHLTTRGWQMMSHGCLVVYKGQMYCAIHIDGWPVGLTTGYESCKIRYSLGLHSRQKLSIKISNFRCLEHRTINDPWNHWALFLILKEWFQLNPIQDSDLVQVHCQILQNSDTLLEPFKYVL